MPTQKHVYTRDDLKRLPDEWWVELVDGDLVLTPSPVPWHQELVKRLIVELCDFLGREQRARVQTSPLDVSIDRTNVYQPDVLVLDEGVKAEGLDWILPPPVWVAEVISPKTGQHDLKKLPFYAGHGVREAWLIYPSDGSVEVHDLVDGSVERFGGGQVITSMTIPGFVLDLEEFFRPG